MANRKLKHVNRRLTTDERARHAAIRAAAQQEFPPKAVQQKPAPAGIPAQIQAARKARGLTWYALARLAGVPNQATIRDIEQGKDVKLSNLQAVASALGLSVELTEIARV